MRIGRTDGRVGARKVCILLLLVSSLGCAHDEVVIFDRGRRVEVSGKDAADVRAIVLEMARASTDNPGGMLSTAEWLGLRHDEVVVEVSFSEKQRISLDGGSRHRDADHILVPLTIRLTDRATGPSSLLLGRTAPFLDRVYGWTGLYVNGPDEFGRQYFFPQSVPTGIEALVAAVDRVGVKAEIPTPAR
jgi:hypothetical protein